MRDAHITDSLRTYCEKHNYTPIEEYYTLGEERGSHRRAIVQDNKTGEQYYLYFDRSRKRRSLARQKKDYELARSGTPVYPPKSRGWRNTTLDNRNKKKRQDENRKDISS
jgi:hypothetical protein